jgi:hypothetical protein
MPIHNPSTPLNGKKKPKAGLSRSFVSLLTISPGRSIPKTLDCMAASRSAFRPKIDLLPDFAVVFIEGKGLRLPRLAWLNLIKSCLHS